MSSSIVIETERLLLRKFQKRDIHALYLLLSDREVNTFLPWFPVKDEGEAEDFYRSRIACEKYFFAICLKDSEIPIGYINVSEDDSHDFGYALRREYWRRGIVTEAGAALIERLKRDGLPYITATHDRNNPRSGAVMQRLGMKYCYSYEEQWQPKDFTVVFRLYQLNLDGAENRVYNKYREHYENHFEETDI